MKWHRCVSVMALAVLVMNAGLAYGAVQIDFVTVGNAGNANDSTGYGAVGYDYRIGKYEVTAGQYTAFLNAVAATDTYGLYNTDMSRTDYGSGIGRTGSSGGYTYNVDSAFVNRPVNYVSFWDAARFVNWLHNGQGNGDTESGAYVNVGDQSTFTRNADARYWIPTENEWYKAAYHKNDGVTDNYWDYPTSSDSTPGRDLNDVSGNNGNYSDNPAPIQSPYYTTVVGEFQNSASPYGTFDQGGNVCEWNETAIGSTRGLRGGYWLNGSDNWLASDRDSNNPANEGYILGFRVASSEASSAAIPEPASMAMWFGLCVAGLLLWRRRK